MKSKTLNMKISIGNEEIEYLINYKRIKNIYLRLHDNKLIVNAPYKTSKEYLEELVKNNYLSLIKKQKIKKSILNQKGEVNILGKSIYLEDKDKLDEILSLNLNEYLNTRYPQICQMMGLTNYPSIKLVRVKTYLGQYNKRLHRVSLNILITHLDKELVDYIIIHELAHIKYPHHQKSFWKHVEVYCPNYRILRKRAKKEFIYYENH